MLLQATLNGPLSKADHAGVPLAIGELVADAVECVQAGARAFHLHPRDSAGRERLDETVDEVVTAVRRPHGLPVGVTTGAWIEPDVSRRVALVSRWRAPDYATVNMSEDGSSKVMNALLDASIGIEAGVWTVEDAETLAKTGLGGRVLRVCIEPVEVAAVDALALVGDIHEALDLHEIWAPRLQHGDGEAAWILIEDAIRRGIATRVGLEDTLQLPDGRPASGNADLVRAARDLGAGVQD